LLNLQYNRMRGKQRRIQRRGAGAVWPESCWGRGGGRLRAGRPHPAGRKEAARPIQYGRGGGARVLGGGGGGGGGAGRGPPARRKKGPPPNFKRGGGGGGGGTARLGEN